MEDYDYEVIEVEEGWEGEYVVDEEEVDYAETWDRDYPEYDYVDISRDSDGDGLRWRKLSYYTCHGLIDD